MIEIDNVYLNPAVFKCVFKALKSFKDGKIGNVRSLFENEFKKMIGSKYCFACHNGTSGLYIALLALNLKEKDEVVTNPLTHISTISAILKCKAKPVFTRINEQGFMDLGDLRKKINPYTKVIIPVHLNGFPENIEGILEIRDKYKDLYVVEDACQALGGKVKINGGFRNLGTISDIGIFSFGVFKLLTTLEGGMIVTDDDRIAERISRLLDNGDYRNRNDIILGYSLRLDYIRSTIGLVNLEDLKEQISARREKWAFYKKALQKFRWLKIVNPHSSVRINYFQFIIYIDSKEKCKKVVKSLCKILTSSAEFPNEYIKLLPSSHDILKRHQWLGEHYILLPTHSRLKDEDMKKIVECFENA